MATIADIIDGSWRGTNVDPSGTSNQVDLEITFDAANQRVEARITFPTGQTQTINGTVDSVTADSITYSWRRLLRRGRGRWDRVDDRRITGSWGNQASFDDQGRFDVQKQSSGEIQLLDAFGSPENFQAAVDYSVYDQAGARLTSGSLGPGETIQINFSGEPYRIAVDAPTGYSAYYAAPAVAP